MVGVRRTVLAVSLAACAGASTSSNAPVSGGSWSELRVSWSYGPCPDDGRSCHQELTVSANGGFITAETSNPKGSGGTGEVERRFSSLTSRETSALHRIVDAPGFLDKLGSFDCPRENDATIVVEVTLASGARKQEIGGCAHASDTAPSPPRDLVNLLEPHRFAGRDVPSTHPPPPAGEGEACGGEEGCAAGLVCAIAPCVVAPCVDGSCQKATQGR
jgi:hypothetical protein